MHIIDIRNELPKNEDPNIVWDVRNSSEITTIVVHQSACKNGTTRGIARYHVRETMDIDGDGVIEAWERNHISAKGAPAICYHYTIDYNGIIYKCNSHWDIVWHAGHKKTNEVSLGICVLGDFSGPTWAGKEEPRPKQLEALEYLIKDIRFSPIRVIPDENILGHCDVKSSKVNCPGTTIMNFIKDTYRT